MKVGEIRNAERGLSGKPLAGLRVLAVEQMQALPYATQLMTHLGAEVVKIEPPGVGESGRAGDQPALRDGDGRQVGATYLRSNLNKKSVCLDLKHAKGQEIFRRLVPRFDLVAENFKPGTMERFGLDYVALAKIFPQLIYVSVSGFGNLDESPYRNWPAYAPVAEAMGGFFEPHRRGEDRPPPVLVAGSLGDLGTGLFAVIGILAALRHRDRTGQGQYVDVAMYDAMIALSDMVPFMWSMGGYPVPASVGTLGIVANFKAKDGYFTTAILREHQFQKLTELLARPEWLGDPRFATREGWCAQIEPLVRPALEAWARDKTKLEAARAFCERGIAAGPCNRAEDLYADPHVALRNMLIEVPRADSAQPMLVVGNPIKMSRLAEGPVVSFPRLGEHTDAVLSSELNLSAQELEILRNEGVI